jgi:hypothetical protein
MSRAVEVIPFFERSEADHDDGLGESYVAGFRSADGTPAGIRVVLPAEIVEQAVLVKAQLSLALNPDGSLTLHADGLSHATLDAASQALLSRQSLGSLLDECLRPDSVAMQDDPAADLTALRTQLADSMALVDRLLARLRGK